jgi:two-component system, chemotaxis family, protein-glutamate methylesterase/glutaminase
MHMAIRRTANFLFAEIKDASVRGHNIVVVGASAGGVEAISSLCSALPRDFPGSIFVVLHTTPSGETRLPEILNRRSKLKAVHPDAITTVEPGVIYVARPNRHLILEKGRVTLSTGPRQSGHRPSINALFESAARHYGNRVTGVILSGSLDDGTLGLLQIKQAGGITLVQSPEDALFTGMPTSALEQVEVDFCGTPLEIAERLVEYAQAGSEVNTSNMDDFPHPIQDKENDDNIDPLPVTGFICPECGGALQQMDTENVLHFRCHVGHEVSEQSLLQSQAEEIERALWIALRILEERIELSTHAAQRASERGNHYVVGRLQRQNEEAQHNAALLRQVLSGTSQKPSITELQDSAPGRNDPEDDW